MLLFIRFCLFIIETLMEQKPSCDQKIRKVGMSKQKVCLKFKSLTLCMWARDCPSVSGGRSDKQVFLSTIIWAYSYGTCS